MSSGLPIQHIEHPAAELFGQCGAGEHGDQMGAAQGEDTRILFTRRGGQFDHPCH